MSAGYVPDPNWTPSSVTQFANNQWIRGTGDAYDPAGNQISLASNTAPDMVSSAFGYDAEDRLVQANVANTGITTYSYDGEGRRVTKTVAGTTTTYVYDAMGQLMAEYGASVSEHGTVYLTADALGSTRLVTTAAPATVVERMDYLPFGEEIGSGIGGRSLIYSKGIYPGSPDVVDQKFTSKERDAETGLDFFGARYFSSAQGRFTSPDEFKGGFLDAFSGQAAFQAGPLPYADISDPQTLNKYCSPQKLCLSLSDLLSQAIIVMQSAENRSGFHSMPNGKPMPMAAGRNLRLACLRDSRA